MSRVTSTPSAEESAVGPTAGGGPGSTQVRRPRAAASPSGGSPARTAPPEATAAQPTVAAQPATAPPAGDDIEASEPRRLLGYRRQRFEARKVRRLIRHVDPWSMLKLSLLVALCMWLIVMIASVILWTVASNAGTIASVEDFVNSSLSLQDWKLDGDFIFRQFGLITLLLALGFAAAVVIASLVFNLVSDIIGGVWVSVIEEETARPVSESKRARRVG